MRRAMVNGIHERANLIFESLELGMPRVINRLDLASDLQ